MRVQVQVSVIIRMLVLMLALVLVRVLIPRYLLGALLLVGTGVARQSGGRDIWDSIRERMMRAEEAAAAEEGAAAEEEVEEAEEAEEVEAAQLADDGEAWGSPGPGELPRTMYLLEEEYPGLEHGESCASRLHLMLIPIP